MRGGGCDPTTFLGRICTPDRIRTGATAVRGQRARPLHNGGFAELVSAVADELCELAYQDSNLD
jgi:hypothetical protein